MKKIFMLLLIVFVFVFGSSCMSVNPVIKKINATDSCSDNYVSLMDSTVKFSEDALILNMESGVVPVKDFMTGSGVVIKTHKKTNTSIVLTVKHVCESESEPGTVDDYGNVLLSTVKYITTSHGERLDVLKVLHVSQNADLCGVLVEGYAGQAVEVASSHPKRGHKVQTTGAPRGFWDADVVNLVEGFYIGVLSTKKVEEYDNMTQWSIPAVYGMSGSPVFYDCKMFGIISHSATTYDNIAWGPSLNQVNLAIEESVKSWENM